MATSTFIPAKAQKSAARIKIDQQQLRESFNREPLGFEHNLSNLDLFNITSLHGLAEKMAEHPRDYFVAAGAAAPSTGFYSVPEVAYKPAEAIERLKAGAYRILLKRAENHDERFRELLHTLFAQVVESLGGLGQKVVRMESGILISSAATITPFHFDPEIGFFSQIEGEKMYHVYSPSVITEQELGRWSLAGPAALAPVDLKGRDPEREYVFKLTAGKGFHQPHNAPHWVETGTSRSISYTFVFETNATRARARTSAFNHYMRKLHLNPSPIGKNRAADVLKGQAMRTIIPARLLASSLAGKLRNR